MKWLLWYCRAESQNFLQILIGHVKKGRPEDICELENLNLKSIPEKASAQLSCGYVSCCLRSPDATAERGVSSFASS
jgi:hypothetical protein